MRREIRFRGKAKDPIIGWVYGDFAHILKGVTIGQIEVEEETVSQFTGLKDKNDNDIYEDDIITLDSWSGVFKVLFCDGAFGFTTEDSHYVNDIHYVHHAGIPQATVIGNVFDNPNLLTDK